MTRQSYVYIMASGYYGTLYIGVTADLIRRVFEHCTSAVPGFTTKYKVHRLVWYEVHEDIVQAITREKQLKLWKRDWKIELINKDNPRWDDLWDDIVG